MKNFNRVEVCSLLTQWGEGIRSAEDVDVFDEHPDFLTQEENWGV